LYIPNVIVIYPSITIALDSTQILRKNQVVFITGPEEKHLQKQGYFVKTEHSTEVHDTAINITAKSQLQTAVMSVS